MVVRRTVVFQDYIIAFVDDWRRTQSPIPSFNKAINTIIKEGVDAIETVKLEFGPHKKGPIQITKEMNDDAQFLIVPCTCDTFPHSPNCASYKEAKTE